MKIVKTDWSRWIDMAGVDPDESMIQRCSVDHLQSALAGIDGVTVAAAGVNRSGQYQPVPVPYEDTGDAPVPFPLLTDLPDFCEVLLHQETAGGHTAKIFVWVPLAWNQRLLAVGGGGTITGPLWGEMKFTRSPTMSMALRNGFAATGTDAGIRGNSFFLWPFAEGGDFDEELVRNWAHRSTHDMATAARAVVEALTGIPPRYSYLMGCSGGGRQALASAQHHPGDFDGVWAADGVLSWTRTMPAGIWPSLVMKELDNPVAVPKLEAFRAAFIKAFDGVGGLDDGIVGAFDAGVFDPYSLVGRATEAGVITERDAEVMERSWSGPRRKNGERLYFGLRPDIVSWGMMGMFATKEVDGALVPYAMPLSLAYFRWVTKDPSFDWQKLTFESFEELFDRGVAELGEIAADEADLSGLRDSGSKLLITQGVDDLIVFYQGAVDYYQRVIEAAGGEHEAASFARLFVTDGDIHGFCTGRGPGITLADGMIALMNWVENAEAPDAIVAERYDAESGAKLGSRPAFAYPMAPRYAGVGNPDESSSFVPYRVPGPEGLAR
ncbi:tannase/feruloyl esterase family alpha/beta hydrolase [Streptomyces chartreusis]|uniref:tannase/feruloyl esterase family alpha/beta hydrolase n=1 Tax=Streptomyces chartreusis TaxID=1969 RepID=UPI003633F844